MTGGACFTGDAVLAESQRLRRARPGRAARLSRRAAAPARDGPRAAVHRSRPAGRPIRPPCSIATSPTAPDRERRLLAALDDGLRTADELLDRVWDDAPASLRLAATATLAAHLGKLDEEGRLPAGVQLPQWPPAGGLRPVV